MKANADAQAELLKTSGLFDTTLRGFANGGIVSGGDERPVQLAAVTSDEGRELLASAQELWRPFRLLLLPLLQSPVPDPPALDAAVGYARLNNLALLALMNKLTTHLERTANAKADLLRKVQTGGIVLALLNFAFILFKFIRRLRDNDRRIEQAQRETAEILGTVKEGLFLLDAQFRVGSQFSASLPQILGRAIEPGVDFREALREMVPQSVYGSACDYIELLLGDRVKESLVTDLNPLTAVEVAVPRAGRRYLTLQFNRVVEDGRVSHLLVTVFDVTTQVELEHALKEARKKARAEVEVMLDLLKVNPASLRLFLDGAEKALLSVNDQLRAVGGPHGYRRMIGVVFRQVHTIKGEAAALGMEMFEQLAQQFETTLAALREKGSLSADDLVGLPLPLDDFLKRISMVRDLSARLAAHHDALAPATDGEGLGHDLESLAQRIARDHGKEVALVADLGAIAALPQGTRRGLKDIAVQLLRNAVVHGIEPVAERMERSKPAAGSVYIGLKAEQGEYEFLLRDDGRGLAPQRIRSALIAAGRYSEAQLRELDDRQVILKIFEPGFSTAGKVGRDAGHGVGMDVVKQKILQLNARLRIATQEHAYTQFSIRFAA